MPRLSELLVPLLSEDPEIGGLTADSREVRPGDLFAALPGIKVDGRTFIPEALKRGASAVLAQPGTGIGDAPATLVTDENPRRRFAQVAARFFGSQPEIMAAVTGTNGKTSVASFTRQIWAAQGRKAASLGTLGLVSPHRTVSGSLTTPDPVGLQRSLAELKVAGITHAVVEASSHGLDQCRLDGVMLAAAAFTNLTRDHLDYHGDMGAYWRAKRRLFAELLPRRRAAVINADTPEAAELVELCTSRGQRVLTYGRNGEDIRLRNLVPTAQGQDMELALFGQAYRLHLPLAGAFQAANALCALGLALVTEGDVAIAAAALEKLEGVPGRLQYVASRANGASLYVDYAHTPDALATVLAALRPHASGKLVVLFGCGGDRDRGKRPEMGRIASERADRIYVTDDNPRSEEPASIRAAILAACPDAIEIGDRREAIYAAVGSLRPGDLLLLAGKGHETGQIFKDVIMPFDDVEEAKHAVAEVP